MLFHCTSGNLGEQQARLHVCSCLSCLSNRSLPQMHFDWPLPAMTVCVRRTDHTVATGSTQRGSETANLHCILSCPPSVSLHLHTRAQEPKHKATTWHAPEAQCNAHSQPSIATAHPVKSRSEVGCCTAQASASSDDATAELPNLCLLRRAATPRPKRWRSTPTLSCSVGLKLQLYAGAPQAQNLSCAQDSRLQLRSGLRT